MYGIFTYIYHQNQPNVDKYTIHGPHGFMNLRMHTEFEDARQKVNRRLYMVPPP